MSQDPALSQTQLSVPERRGRVLTLFTKLERDLELTLDGSSPTAEEFRFEVLDRTETLRLRMAPVRPHESDHEEDTGPRTQEPDNPDDQDQDEPERPAKPSKPVSSAAMKRRLRAEKRLGSIMTAASQPPIKVDEFKEHVVNPVQGEHAETEDAAFKRLVRGYDGLEGSTQWRDGLGNLFDNPEPLSLEEEIEAHDKRNRLRPAQRLTANQRALEHGFNISAAQMHSQHILEQVCVASFAIDWLAITGENSNKEKAAFYIAAYQDLEVHRTHFRSMTAAQRQEQMTTDHKAAYWTWRGKLEPQITARNRFVSLYHSFGPAVFMDPFWNVANLTNNARTKEFPVLLALLLENIPSAPDEGGTVAETRYHGSSKALRGTLRAIDSKLWYFVREFLDENPDHVPDHI